MNQLSELKKWNPINAHELEYSEIVSLDQPVLEFTSVKLMINLEQCGEKYTDFINQISTLFSKLPELSKTIEQELLNSEGLVEPFAEAKSNYLEPVITYSPEEGEDSINWSFSFKECEHSYLYIEFTDCEFQEVWGGD